MGRKEKGGVLFVALGLGQDNSSPRFTSANTAKSPSSLSHR
jgi:hypothetical protein